MNNRIPSPAGAAFIGGAVGGFVAILVVAAAIGCVVIVLVKRHLHPTKPHADIPERDDMQLNNPVYNGGDYNCSYNNLSLEGWKLFPANYNETL